MALGDFGVNVSPNTVARLLHQMGYSLRVNHKKLSTDFSPDRNDQFLYLSDLRQRFQRRGLPIISVDTKKRELVGTFKNPGSRWDLSPRLVNDHDFRSDSTGVPSLTVSMICSPIEGRSWWASLMTHPPLRRTPLNIGGAKKGRSAIHAPGRSSS
jgi:Rhodopirellula transposase DDE domain